MASAPRWALLLVALLGFTPTVHADEPEPDDAHREAVAAVLAAWEAKPQTLPRDVSQRLRSLGTSAFPAVLAAAEASKPGSPAADVLEGAVDLFGTPRLRSHLLQSIAGEALGPERLRALRILGRFGKPDALPVAVSIAQAIDPTWLPVPRVGRAWEEAFRGLLADGIGRHTLVRTLHGLPSPLYRPTATVLAERGDAEALEGLLALLGAAPRQAPVFLSAMARARPLALARVAVEPAVREWLAAKDPAARRAAASLAARARIEGVFPRLVALLDDEEPQVRRSGRQALEALAGTTAGGRAEAWRTWHKAELHWLEASGIAERLEAADPGLIARALGEVVRHRMVAAGLIDAVADLTQHRQPAVRSLACAALGRLGRLEATAPLVEALADKDAAVQAAALRALVQLTGEALPAERRAWRRALAQR